MDGGLVDADRTLDPRNEKVVDLVGFDPAVEAFGFEGGEGALLEDRRVGIPDGSQRLSCRAELFRELFRRGDGDTEQFGRL